MKFPVYVAMSTVAGDILQNRKGVYSERQIFYRVRLDGPLPGKNDNMAAMTLAVSVEYTAGRRLFYTGVSFAKAHLRS